METRIKSNPLGFYLSSQSFPVAALLILIMPTMPCGMKAYTVHRQPAYMEVMIIVVSLTSSTGEFALDSLR